jgi:6-pyruvoyltetrahydropterin/6-carboxytetrahydropterin synthase
MLITRKIEFSSSHFCRNPKWSDAENERIYGSAANPNGHGHNYIAEVTLAGDPDPVTGMVMDLKILKDILNHEIVEPFDHRHLNHEVPPFDHLVPTAENITVEMWRRLKPLLPALHTIRLYETPDLFVEYAG